MEMPSVYVAGFLALLVVGLAACPSAAAGDAASTRTVTVSSVTHVNVKSSKSYEAVIAAIENISGHLTRRRSMRP
jgi:hypothetical protein